ncbi:hypothetical protein GALMADRAFT_142731 [Galerina marginata CBS 339.88]|uniref:PARP catalytic domain-containing protein n=1 Tax=Galerina marginata (strain CBS 339.88) TaxID=685588 RepID=A0A067SQ84_GALM3|nr:hypothetical protein GALMADRAFT_142731 [Galerina marginata CBS 339.88]
MLFLYKILVITVTCLYAFESSYALPLSPRVAYEDVIDGLRASELAPRSPNPVRKPALPSSKSSPHKAIPIPPALKPSPSAPKPSRPIPSSAAKPSPPALKPSGPIPSSVPKPSPPALKPSPPKSSSAPATTNCPLPSTKKPTTSGLTQAKRALDHVLRIFARDETEFIGFHGTNSATADFWTNQNFISKPPSKSNSFFDFIGGILSPKGGSSGSSGADAELGPGLYVTDDPDIASAFANNNAKVNVGSTPKVCAIFVKSSDHWRGTINKVFLPEDTNLIGDSGDATRSAAFENSRQKYIGIVRPGVQASTTVRFSILDRKVRK